MLKLTLISAVLLGLGFAGIAIKIWAKKDGEFDGTCSSRNAIGKGCACGGGGGACQNPGDHDHDHHHDEVPTIAFKKIS